MRDLLEHFKHLPLSQQLGFTAAICCLTATLILVAVTSRSTQFVQEELLGEYGEAVANQLARRLSSELATGDRLAVVAELNRVSELRAIARATARGVDGVAFADAGQSLPAALTFSADITIDGDIAGEVRVEVDTSRQSEARHRFVFALLGLSVLLAIVIYSVSKLMAQRLATKIDAASGQLAEVIDSDIGSDNELQRLQHRIAALPLELLTPSAAGDARDEHYDDTAVLYITLKSLPGYVNTLDAPRLHRYVALVHRLVYGAAGFYAGELQVVRQFGLAVYFRGSHKAGSPALRATSCAWLLQQAAAPAEAVIRLSLKQGLAVGVSELGPGDGRDIYPGLYTQATLDELRELAEGDADALLLSPAAAQDVDVTTRLKVDTLDQDTYLVGDLADGHRDLLERQLQIMLNAVLPEAEAREPPRGGVSVEH